MNASNPRLIGNFLIYTRKLLSLNLLQTKRKQKRKQQWQRQRQQPYKSLTPQTKELHNIESNQGEEKAREREKRSMALR